MSRAKNVMSRGTGKVVKPQKFIISVFGESGAGKSTLLRGVIHDIIDNSKLSICDAEGFVSRDRRVATWYRTGKTRQGIVSICTAGDSPDVIKANIKFFKKNSSCWKVWFRYSNVFGKKRKMTGREPQNLKDMPRILITSARKPLEEYQELRGVLRGCKVLNIPVAFDVWKLSRGEKLPDGAIEWMLPRRTTAESLFQLLRYILIHNEIKRPTSADVKKNRVVNCADLVRIISRD